MKKLISIAILIFTVNFTSFAQDTIPIPDTLVYPTGEKILINFIKIKSNLIE